MKEDIQIPGDNDKVIQLYIDGRPILRKGSIMIKHSWILEDALNEFGVPFETMRIGRHDVPKLSGDRYKVAGMGMATRVEDEVTLCGKSVDYNLKVNQEHADACKPLLPSGLTLICYIRD